MWDTRYRPLRFADVLGQEGNVQLLKSRLKNGTAFDTSYIFAGAFGRGKTTLSRIHARAMLCQALDKSDPEPCNQCDNCRTILLDQPGAFVERDASSHGSVDHIRAIVEDLPYVISNAQKRIYLFDEAHRLTVQAQDALLKPLEEKRMVGMFCTTEASKIRGAIRSRCEEYIIRKVSREDILKRMRMVLETENVSFEDDGVLIVIDHSGGHVRDVLNKLEMLAQLGPVTVDNVREYLHLSAITLYYQILLYLGDPLKAVELLDQVCEQVAPEDIAAGLAEAAMNTYRLAHGMHADFAFVDRNLATQVYQKYGNSVVKFAYWFLGLRYPTKLSLTRDIVVFSQNPNNLPLDTPSPPVVLASVTQYTTATPQHTTSTVGVEVHQTQPVSIPAVIAEPSKTIASAGPTRVPSETEDLSEMERQVASAPMPRRRSQEQTRPEKVKHKSMSPEEWRSNFEYSLRKRTPWTLPS